MARGHSAAHRLRSGWPVRAANGPIQVPKPGEIPRHEQFYYLECYAAPA